MHNKTHEICNGNDVNTDPWAMLYKKIDVWYDWNDLIQNHSWSDYAWAATLSSVFNWLAMSLQFPDSICPNVIQWDGGFGSNSGDGGSLNLAPAYAFSWGDGDLDKQLSARRGGGEIRCASANLRGNAELWTGLDLQIYNIFQFLYILPQKFEILPK